MYKYVNTFKYTAFLTVCSKIWIALLLVILIDFQVWAQSDCNKLGAWLWYIEISGFDTHQSLADSLKSLGVKRIYIKVADGRPNPAIWPELKDKNVVQAYASRGLEVWAWSYNYPGNEKEQAEALKTAAETGYQGFVVDVESEFDNKPQDLLRLFKEFSAQRDYVRTTIAGKDKFALYCTTWGNPGDHKYSFQDIDPYLDGYKPQTYIENWGGIYYTNAAYWIQYGTDEYKSLGATKPVHHIVSTEKGIITPEKIEEFFRISGPESSVWVVPGENTSFSLWDKTWKKINWRLNFCSSNMEDEILSDIPVMVYPNPGTTHVQLFSPIQILGGTVFNLLQRPVSTFSGNTLESVSLPAGVYIIAVQFENGKKSSVKWIISE